MLRGKSELSKTFFRMGGGRPLGCSKITIRGFSLIETMITMTVLSISLMGIFSALITCMQVRKMNENNAMARNAAEGVLSGIRGMPGIVEAYQRFGGGGSEETFTVRGLQDPSANEPCGRVIVWRLKSSIKNRVNPPQPDPGSALAMSKDDVLAAQTAFAESYPNIMETMANMSGTAWDDYIDTNTDGVVNDLDEPQIMAVTVRIRWRSHSGLNTRYFSGIIGRR